MGCDDRLMDKYTQCVVSTTKLACTGGAAAWEAKWLNSALTPIRLHYNCTVNIGLYTVSLQLSAAARSAYDGISVTRGIFAGFRPTGRHVAPMGAKFGM